MAATVSPAVIRKFLPQILSNMPEDWRGTTFNNSQLLQRRGFSERLIKLVSDKESSNGSISVPDLTAIGNAEDYLRVSSNISTTLEIALGAAKGYEVSRVFTFSSRSMPFVAVGVSTQADVHVFYGDADPPFSEDQLKQLATIGSRLSLHPGAAEARDGVVLVLESALEDADAPPSFVDGVVAGNVLFIVNESRIDESKVLVVRKRMNTPVTTPMAEAMLQELAGVPVTANKESATPEEVAALYAHLQQLSGTAVNVDANPVICTAGLSTLCSLWVALANDKGADILMCSTAYGGSSQLVDVLTASTGMLKKHTFDIQGTIGILDGIGVLLDRLVDQRDQLLPTTVLMVEMPTNPDMKVPDLPAVAQMLSDFQEKSGTKVLLLIDATFAPNSQVLAKLKELLPNLPVFVFLSLSKSVSRGKTTGGTLIANHTAEAVELLSRVRSTAELLDTTCTRDQLLCLTENHRGVEERCDRAYQVAVSVGQCLQDAVKEQRGEEMRLAFVTPAQAKLGFTSSTFSFNLPPRVDATPEDSAGLAQEFVDLLCKHPVEFKPCVSFGQDNGLVYATVPATSTQGAIKEEDKAKQAVGGVQLVRLSFAPGCNVEVVTGIVRKAVEELYQKSQ